MVLDLMVMDMDMVEVIMMMKSFVVVIFSKNMQMIDFRK